MSVTPPTRPPGDPAPARNPTPAPPTGSEPDQEPDDSMRQQYGLYLGSAVIPPDLDSPENRRKVGVPEDPDEPGEYMAELNLLHSGGLPAADVGFITLYRAIIGREEPRPVRVAKTYYSCWISLNEARRLVAADLRRADGPKDRVIYRIWPDFPVRAQIDRSVATVKADAALKSYDASGADIVWAVIDSGVDQGHPHFGRPNDPNHLLLSKDVAQLHRCFTRIAEPGATVPIRRPLEDPDTKPAGVTDEEWAKRREELIKRHVESALQDDYGHGTHVAGIISGGLDRAGDTGAAIACQVFERTFKVEGDGKQVTKTVTERAVRDLRRLRGVAPNCRLVSLRVLDERGDGRASDIMRALEYVREHLNDNPKIMRVHGVNLSVGYEFDAEMFACGQSPLCAEVDRLVQAGVVVVTAAGNTGYGTVGADQRAAKVGLSNTINDPGNAAGAITVGATHRDAPHTYGVSYFSSKGPTGDGRLKPDLVAPGERITSCAAGAKLRNLPVQPAAGVAYYIDDSGTSMAAPHVSGAIAGFLSIRREFIGKPHEVKRIFLQSATSLGRERYFEGHGLVDLMRAIQSV
jgi:subtilisin family serine protease